MRQLNTQEVQNVAGAGLLTTALVNTFNTTVAAGTAAGAGLVAAGAGLASAGAIVLTPVVTGTVKAIKFLI